MRKNSKRLYRIWVGMKSRCNNPHRRIYKCYGGRGISVCEEWSRSYESFEKWSDEHGYRDDLTIDRIDVNGNYEPGNCRWISTVQQNRNKRTNVYVMFNGRRMCCSECEEITGISKRLISRRIRSGWSAKDAVSRKVSGPKKITYNGMTMSMNAWSKHLGLSRNTVRVRLSSGWTIDRALSR